MEEDFGLQGELASGISESKAIGGYARAKALSPERRTEIAKAAANTKWGKVLPKVEHRGILKIGDIEIPCFVLNDFRRVISGRGMTAAIGMKGRGQGVARIASHRILKSNENNDLVLAIENPIQFTGGSPRPGIPSDGYEATVLQELSEAILKARDKGEAKTEQELRYIQCADILIRAFAKVGIIALVDEATGFQDVRAKTALASILEQFIAKELRPYVKTFPLDFFRELCRLRGIEFPKDMKLPPYFGKLINNLVYCRLAPGVLEELRQKNPVVVNGKRKDKHYRWLTENIGHPRLLQLLGSEVTLMKMSAKFDEFKKLVDRFHPPYKSLPLFDWAEREGLRQSAQR